MLWRCLAELDERLDWKAVDFEDCRAPTQLESMVAMQPKVEPAWFSCQLSANTFLRTRILFRSSVPAFQIFARSFFKLRVRRPDASQPLPSSFRLTHSAERKW